MLKTFYILAIVASVALLSSLTAISYLSSPPSGHSSEQEGASQADKEEQAKERHSVSGFIRYLFPDGIAVFTFWLVIATIVLGVGAIIQIGYLERAETISAKNAQAAKDSADVARDTLVATNRAWIQVKSITIAGPLGFGREYGDDVGGGVDLILLVKNVGKSPAIRVGANAQLAFGFDALASQKEFCDGIKRSRDPALQPNTLPAGKYLVPR